MTMWHVETFDTKVPPSEMEAHLRRALKYWRSRGFNVRVFVTQYALGPAMYWLCTELKDFGDFNKWPEMALGDDEGREIMDQLTRMQLGVRASLVRELEV